LPHFVVRALACAVALVLLSAAAASAAAAQIVPGELIVRFAPEASSSARTAALNRVGADATTATRLPDTRLVTLDDDADVRAAARQLAARSDVLWAEPNYVVHPARVPNDPDFGALWGLDNTGQTVEQTTGPGSLGPQAGVPGVDVNVLPVWDITTGSAAVRIGVADTGVAYHEDLDANLDTTLSRDFVGADIGVTDPFADAHSHGTHVAGTIGAVGNNGIGVAGAMWNADLVALRVLGASGGTSLQIANGFAYAGQIGLPIVNASLGSPSLSQAIWDAIRLSPNTLFVVAAGNDGKDNDSIPDYPCDYPEPNVVCVASIDNDGGRSWYSNYGAENVDLGAPGNQILSTVPTYDATALAVTSTWAHSGAGDAWTFDGGTSTWSTAISDNMDAVLTADEVFDLTGRHGCSASVRWSADFPSGEALLVLERGVGGLWDRIGVRATPTTARTEQFDLKADESSAVALRVRVVAGEDADGSTATVSGLGWRCVRSGSSSLYERMSGTSMATPQVAGVAGLLKAVRPDLTVAQLRTALLSTVTPTPSLTGVTATGGRVNAAAALASVTAVPPAPSPGGGGTTPTPAPAPTPDPFPVPAPQQPTAVTPPASAPRATLQHAGGRLLTRGVLTLRTAVSSTATVRATATLRWHGGKATLRSAVRRGVKPGTIATLQLRANAKTQRALRAARREGRRVRVRAVLTVSGEDGAVRRVVRTFTVR